MKETEIDSYWETVVNTIQDAVMIVDPDGTIVSVNEAFERITGYTRSEIQGQSCRDLDCQTCRDERKGSNGFWCRLFETGGINRRRCAVRRKSGSFVPVIKNAAVLKNDAGQVIGGVETLTDIREIVAKDDQIAAFRRQLAAEDGFNGIIGNSPEMQRVFELIANAANSDAPVIVLGESGTGKEMVARAIHDLGPRREGPYVKVNCAALNESLLESELFGHVKGAFTGAIQNRQGRFEAAHQGDIFLDEIGDLPMSTQVKLLRVLEEKVIERVGDHRPIHTDARVITATNRDLPELARSGRFREDLFYRINVIPIHLPPLRDRKEDVPLLAQAFFRRLQLKSGKAIDSIAYDAMAALMAYEWPGNVRELRSAFEFAFVSCPSGSIEPVHLPPTIIESHRPAGGEIGREVAADPAASLMAALRQADGNLSEAARLLGVSRGTIYNRMRRYGITLEKVASGK